MQGASEGSFYTLDDVANNRTLMKPFLPQTNINRFLSGARSANEKKNSLFKYEKKKPRELRLISADIARVAGKDASEYICMRLLETSHGYDIHVVYIESHQGMPFDRQSIRIKQLREEFDADYVCVDVTGMGHGLLDMLTIPNPDENTGIEYEAWNTIKPDQMTDNRSIPRDAPRIIYPIRANEAMNYQMAIDLKAALERRKIRFLITASEARDNFKRNVEFQEMDEYSKAHALLPFVQTDDFTMQITNLVTIENASGRTKITNAHGNRKDKWSAILYGLHVALQFERDIIKPRQSGDAVFNMAKGMAEMMNNKRPSFGMRSPFGRRR